MIYFLFFTLTAFSLNAQSNFIIHTKSKKITVDHLDPRLSISDASIELDSSIYVYSLDRWNDTKPYQLDTFQYYRIIVRNKKNTIYIYPNFSKNSYKLPNKLKGQSLAVQDSIVRDVLRHRYNRNTSHKIHTQSFELLPVQFFEEKYLYCDIEDRRVYYNHEYEEKLFLADWSRVFIIDDMFYEFSVTSNDDYSKRPKQSKEAVKCAFECLMNSITIRED